MKIALIGGSFDPVHNGHTALANAIEADEVWFIPAKDTPLKARALTPAYHRKAMLELACNGHPNFKVCDIELKREGKSYTVDTIEQIHQENPNDELFWIIGTDQASQFDKWKDPERLMELATFIVVNREGAEPPVTGYPFLFVTQPPIKVSSTDIRNKKNLDMLNSKVLEYIQENNLYGFKSH